MMSETPVTPRTGKTNTQAYEEYLKDWFFWHLRTVDDHYRAKENLNGRLILVLIISMLGWVWGKAP